MSLPLFLHVGLSSGLPMIFFFLTHDAASPNSNFVHLFRVRLSPLLTFPVKRVADALFSGALRSFFPSSSSVGSSPFSAWTFVSYYEDGLSPADEALPSRA